MNIARVVGQVVASKKVEGLLGAKFLVVELLDEHQKYTKKWAVAVDTVRAGVGDIVSVVSSREASLALSQNFVPVDTAIVGIVDSLEVGVDQ